MYDRTSQNVPSSAQDYAVVLARGGKNFRVKVGKTNSPWLAMVEAMEIDTEGNRVFWKFWKPRAPMYTDKNKQIVDSKTCADPGFLVGSHWSAWSVFELDEGMDESTI